MLFILLGQGTDIRALSIHPPLLRHSRDTGRTGRQDCPARGLDELVANKGPFSLSLISGKGDNTPQCSPRKIEH